MPASSEGTKQTIAYDRPGFGQSGAPADHSVEYRVQHDRAFIDALGLTPYHLMGGYGTARLALEDARIDRLVLVANCPRAE